MTDTDFKEGDVVQHAELKKTVGILLRPILYSLDIGSPVWEIYWLKHPDIEQYGNWSSIGLKWVKKFKPWPGFYSE